jgi:hypothetical protein
MIRIAAAACPLVVVTACGGSSPTGPSTRPTGFHLAVEKTSTAVVLRAELPGETLTSNASLGKQLEPGTYTLTGDFAPTGQASAEGVTFTFDRYEFLYSGGVRAGSLVSLLGPVASASNCTISYLTPAATTAVQAFSLRFEVTADSAGVC